MSGRYYYGQSSNSRQTKPKGQPQKADWEIYDNPNIQARDGWESEPTPWTALIATRYVGWVHVDRAFWPRERHERNCINANGKWTQVSNIPMKWRMLCVLRAISDDRAYAKHNVPLAIAAMVYAESVLNVEVDWSSLPSSLRESYLVRRPINIPIKPMPQWFNDNPDLLEKPAPSDDDDDDDDPNIWDEVREAMNAPRTF